MYKVLLLSFRFAKHVAEREHVIVGEAVGACFGAGGSRDVVAAVGLLAQDVDGGEGESALAPEHTDGYRGIHEPAVLIHISLQVAVFSIKGDIQPCCYRWANLHAASHTYIIIKVSIVRVRPLCIVVLTQRNVGK